MGELINKNKLLAELWTRVTEAQNEFAKHPEDTAPLIKAGELFSLYLMIGNEPTVDAVPATHGKWEWAKHESGEGGLRCSACKQYPITDHLGSPIFYDIIGPWHPEFCPHCGAKMEYDEKDEDMDLYD